MQLKPRYKIGGHWFEIKYPYIFQERFDRFGQCDDPKKIIYITDVDGNGAKRAESAIVVTFIHEILHAIDLNTGHHIFEGKEGEEKLEGFSEGIYTFLIDNGFLK